jgi:ribA/ribD-fused uncharacterized protein
MKITDEYVFFVSGPFSNWYESYFEVNQTKYNCGEQFMMFKKAIHFGDYEIANEIMRETNPRKQKAWGREVRGFDQEEWNKVSKELVYEGLYAKFTQNEDLKEILLSTGDREIVEAAWYDTVWGVGLREDDPLILDKSNWKGMNYLGIVLMRVRDAINAEITV